MFILDLLRLSCSGDESSVGRYSIVGTSSLQISNVSLEDGAVYTCRGENEQGMVESEATLTVQGTSSAAFEAAFGTLKNVV